MGTRSGSESIRDKVRAHRRHLRQQGLRPIQIWVPDMRSPSFAAEARRQSLAVARSPHASLDQDFIDAISEGPVSPSIAAPPAKKIAPA
jgi:antidote-toxin recognition MazE-like antitoxin